MKKVVEFYSKPHSNGGIRNVGLLAGIIACPMAATFSSTFLPVISVYKKIIKVPGKNAIAASIFLISSLPG